jgi:hypothetical protein
MGRMLNQFLVALLLLTTINPDPITAQPATPVDLGEQRITFASDHEADTAMAFDLYTIAVDETGLTRLTTLGDEGMQAVAPT